MYRIGYNLPIFQKEKIVNKKRFFKFSLVLVLFTLASFGCTETNEESSEKAASLPPDQAVKTAFKNFMDQKSYTSTVEIKAGDETQLTEASFLGPDKFQILNHTPDGIKEIVVIGEDTFTRDDGGKWEQVPPGQGINLKEIRDNMSEDAAKSMKDFKALDAEVVNGKSTHVYSFNSTFGGGDTNSKIWVQDGAILPLKVLTEGELNGVKASTTITYDYDQRVDIPSPGIK